MDSGRERLKRNIFMYMMILSSFSILHSSAIDSITVSSLLGNGQTLVSAGERFELGFFSSTDSFNDFGRYVKDSRPYVGIWYYKSNPKILVWVANRDNPILDDTGFLAIAEDGNLKLLDGNGKVYWYTGVESLSSLHTVAKLMDSGNLVLKNISDAMILWESFRMPTDTFLAGMYMDKNLSLTSWTSPDDPKAGNFTFKMDQGENQFQILNGIFPYWRSAESNDVFNSDEIIPDQILDLILNFSQSVNSTGNTYNNNSIPMGHSRSRLVMDFTGKIQFWSEAEDKLNDWSLIWWEPRDPCSVFHYCGNFGICSSSSNKSECKCLNGFLPKFPENWKSGDFSGGCSRTNYACGGNDGFLRLKKMTMGKTELQISVTDETECSKECLNQCQCLAFSYEVSDSTRRDNQTGVGKCWIWTEDLNNLQEDSSNGGRDLYVRVAASNLENDTNKTGGDYTTHQDEAFSGRNTKQPLTLIFGVTIAGVIILSLIIVFLYARRKTINKQESRTIIRSNMATLFYDRERHAKEMVDSDQFKGENKKGIDLPFFDFESILVATDNFSEAKKLGKGGFGPVYKGKFPGGQEIAVKRLSILSQQGLDEFNNEIVLIARLQHRNLVRLLGYCIEGDEKILLYEYMPNKSLDIFIFDHTLSVLLEWETRFNIIFGIARGLLYLHQDSRLRIIHRDLKTSNILLDQEMNPKISDFGLARIFEGKQTEGTTNRVVGTYGYMSPEYALEGFFSIKSDVFSFGVVVLEIISGKRNTGFYNSPQALSLLGHAWKLWQEENALDMVDLRLRAGSKTNNEILKCIHIGLLCVQENPNDRPTMSSVVIMLGSEATTNLPSPKRPAFVVRTGPSSTSINTESINELTVTLEVR